MPLSARQLEPLDLGLVDPALDRFEVRYVSANGGIHWNRAWVNVSTCCAGDYVRWEEIDDGVWNVFF